jgi:hypothetical protein
VKISSVGERSFAKAWNSCDAYRRQHGPSLSSAQRRVVTAIQVCRTAALGGHLKSAVMLMLGHFFPNNFEMCARSRERNRTGKQVRASPAVAQFPGSRKLLFLTH